MKRISSDISDSRRSSDNWPQRVKVGSVSVTVYRRERADGSPGFEVADYSTGSRRLRSFPTAETALSEAGRIARLMASGDVTAARVTGKEVASYARAIEFLRPTGLAIEVAADNYRKAFEILGGDRILEAAKFFAARNPDSLPARTVADVVSELVTIKTERGASARYVEDLRARLGRFAKAFAVQIASVQPADVQGWLDGLKASPQTVKNFRTVVSTLFSFAERRGYILKGSNPAADTEQPKVNGSAPEIFTPSELAKLLASATPDFLPALAICAFGGLRTAEIQRLVWGDVDLAGGFITVGADKAKTRTRRIVPILPALAAWLATHTRKSGQVWKGTAEKFNHAQQATAAAAGVQWRDNGLRHSFASYRLAQTQSAAQVSLEMGNSPQVVFRHYRELVKPGEAVAWFAVAPQTPANVVTLTQQAA
jgi:integrase